jgi:hypothetical protein
VGINGNQGVKINLVGGKSSNPKTKTKARPNMIKFKKIQKSSKGRHFSIHSPSMLGNEPIGFHHFWYEKEIKGPKS